MESPANSIEDEELVEDSTDNLKIEE